MLVTTEEGKWGKEEKAHSLHRAGRKTISIPFIRQPAHERPVIIGAIAPDAAVVTSGLQAKDIEVTEVAIMEAVEKAKAGEAVKRGGNRRNAHNAQILGESEGGKPHEQ